jgi:hypothetical protein
MIEYESIFEKLFLKGLCESQFPFNFVAINGFVELLDTKYAYEKAVEVLPKLIIPIKNALVKQFFL